MFLGDCRVAADGVVLIGDPDDEDDVEGGRRVLEELGHDGLHSWKTSKEITKVLVTISKVIFEHCDH